MSVIARIWKGAVRLTDGDEYAAYMRRTGIKEYAATPGNIGIYMLRRNADDRCEFVMLTLWESEESIRAFAGEVIESAVFYPEDDRFLLERDLSATHYVVETNA
jgi:heme-degrading monooxygenase HmoA